MTIQTYRDFVLAADVVERGADGLARAFAVRVFASPAGEGAPLRRELPDDLGKVLGRLDRRKLDLPGIIGLGEVLADLLLPAAAREMLVQSLARLGAGEGLRLRREGKATAITLLAAGFLEAWGRALGSFDARIARRDHSTWRTIPSTKDLLP